MSKLYEFSDSTELVSRLSERIIEALEKDIQAKGSALLAVSGGSSPKPLFAHLSHQSLDWEKVTIVLVDERWVSPNHVDSNEAMVRANLLTGAAASAKCVGWVASMESLQEAARLANERFKELALPFSAVILGMGSDGHTASWFADAPEYASLIDPSQEPAVCVAQPGAAAHLRLTLNYAAVTNTQSMFLQINGPEKKATLDRAISQVGEDSLPISHLLKEDSPLEIYWSAT